ncbi:LysR substrate-binding domain-containing protein [Rhizobium rosettiformans]|uniref:HTH-type transcriptional regulator TtuA n=2 Tax=Rhizobium rosettiformans TaxID=1368430 RepID=A0A4S8PZL7_9HYPH|nr:LysR substrate-binding domain-containing protein [Rhizobium rosettiformans]THV35512.1 LysR family transcriptional regulator [Rhizobium rosettiformans W3]
MHKETLSMKLSKQLPLNALRVFEAVARLESFTRAGEELGMSQTAVSYQIKLLEAHVGEALFLRRPRRISLSESGERLLPKVTEGFELLREALADLRNTADGTLIIHATATFASQWLARHLGLFQLNNPGIAVRLETSQEVIDFSRTEADLAIRSGKGLWPGLRAHFVMHNHFTPMLSPKLADSIGGVREPLDLLKLRIIDPSDPWWRIWFTAAGYPDVELDSHQRTRLGAQSFEAAAAVAGHGIAILRPEFYPEEIASGALIQPFELTCEDGSHYWLVYPEARRNAGKIRAFREFLRSTLPSFEAMPAGAKS